MSMIETLPKEVISDCFTQKLSSEEIFESLISKAALCDKNVEILNERYKKIEEELKDNPLGHIPAVIGKQITETFVNIPFIVKFLLISHKNMKAQISKIESLCEHLVDENISLKKQIKVLGENKW